MDEDRSCAKLLLCDHALKNDRQIEKLYVRNILEQFPVLLCIDKLVDYALLYTLIIQKIPHIHALVDLVPVICIH